MTNKNILFFIISSFLFSFEGDKHDYYLPNGLKVIIYEKHTHPTIAVNVAYDIGSHDDPIGKKGLAHIMAKLMDEGSKNYKRQEHLAIVESTGGWSGFTWWELEDFMEFRNISTSDNLELLLKLESDRMSSLLIDSESLKNAKSNVISIIEENMEDSFWEIKKAILSVFPKNHPYSFDRVGSLDDVETISIEDCQTTYDKYFTPNNAILVIVGDIDPLNSFNLITKYFGNIKPSESLPNNPNLKWEIIKNKNINVYEVKNWPFSTYVEFFSIPNPQNEDFLVIEFLSTVLRLDSSPFKKFVSEDDYLSDGWAYFDSKLGDGVFGFVLESDIAKTNYKKHENAVKKILKNLKKNGIDESFLKVAINNERMNLYRRNYNVNWVARNLVIHEIIQGDYKTYFDTAQLYENISNEDFKRVAKKYLVNGYKFAIKQIK